jgi:hypothetical protein
LSAFVAMTLGDAFNRRKKVSTRQYTVPECREKIAAILAEDEQLALVKKVERKKESFPAHPDPPSPDTQRSRDLAVGASRSCCGGPMIIVDRTGSTRSRQLPGCTAWRR